MLKNCTASGGDAVPCSTPLYSDASALIASDPRFEVLVGQKLDHLSGQPVSVSTNSIDFRVTGTIEYGVSVEEASAIHGIDFNRMNRELAKRVNGCSGPVSILPVQLPTGLQVCRHALSEGAPFFQCLRWFVEIDCGVLSCCWLLQMWNVIPNTVLCMYIFFCKINLSSLKDVPCKSI